MEILNKEQLDKLKKVGEYILPYRNIMFSAVIIAISFLVIKGVFSHYHLRLKGLSAELEEIKERRLLFGKWERISRDYEEVKEKFFPQVRSFKEYLGQGLKENNISVGDFNPSLHNQGNFEEASLSFSFHVPYNAFVNFIRFLEEKNIQIESIVVTGQGEEKNITIDLKAFILK